MTLGRLCPKYAKRFAEIGELMRKGITDYITEVKNGTFPSEEHTYSIDEDVINEIVKEYE